MVSAGSYTYICKDCEVKQILTRAARASRFRPRCSSCGSLRLEPVNKDLVGKRMLQHDYALIKQRQKVGIVGKRRR